MIQSLVLGVLLTAARLNAQFTLDWFTLDGGGGASAGGGFTLTGTIGQPDAAASSGGGYSVQGGFWSASLAPFTNSPALRIELTGANVLLTWPHPSTGFQLEKTLNLTAPQWTNVNTAPVQSGPEWQVLQSVTPGAHFYRLRRP